MADKGNIKFLQQLRDMQESLNKAISSSLDLNTKILLQEEAIANQKRIQAEQERLTLDAKNGTIDLTKKEENKLKNILTEQEKITKSATKESNIRSKILSGLNSIKNTAINLGKELLAQDKIIKSTSLNLGLSGSKAEMMRLSFEQSANNIAMLGGSIQDISTIQTGFAEETGRARTLTSQMLEDVVAIGKGTGLGVEQATKLSAQFEIMGVDVKKTMKFTQGVVDTSERMGINTTKVLKNINTNFKRLNTYTFNQGTKGIAKMAEYAEKFKVDINEALNAADTARTLEGAINLAANLQVMGGEFAKTDPFQMLFLSRNDPAKFTQKISEMTKGVVTFRKMADGSFEKFISPADRDRLANVAKSLGMQKSELTEIAQRQADIGKMRKEMTGTGLSAKDKELIEGAAIFNSETGKFQVQVAGHMKDINTLTISQAAAFGSEHKLLSERAKEAQTFDEIFLNTIKALKATLLPLLEDVNDVLEYLRPAFESIAKIGLPGAAASLLGAGLLWKTVTQGLGAVAGQLVGGITKKTNLLPTKMLGKSESAVGGAGKGSFGAGAGVGAAALGTGAGIAIAAVGISKLADSMSKLTDKQAANLAIIATTLAVTFPLAAIGILAVGGAAEASVVGLLALGGAMLMIGGGIGIAAWGIGQMASGLSKLVDSGTKAGDSLFTMSLGMAAMAGSLMLFMGGGLGLLVFAGTLATIASRADAIAKVGDAFGNINTVMSGSKEDWITIQNAIESISKSNIRGSGMFSELTELLKNPIKVEFSKKEVNLKNDITLNLDRDTLMHKLYNTKIAANMIEEARAGKSSNKVG